MNDDKIKKLLGEPVANLCQSFLDKFIEANVEHRHKLGMGAVITRRMVSNCCNWCKGLVGIYEYGTEPKNVYRRHDNCKCLVTYKSYKGGYKDVHSKQEFKNYSTARIKKILDDGIDDDIIKQKNVFIHENKIKLYLLKPGAKHSAEFFDVGFSVGDDELLKRQLLNAFDIEKAIFNEPKDGEFANFYFYAYLGVTKKKRFKIVWRIDKEGDIPRFITAYRKDD